MPDHLSNDLLSKARQIMGNPTTFGTVAAGLCLQLFDEEACLDWDPAILDQELSGMLGEGNVHPDVLQRLHAATVLLADSRFFEDPAIFHAVAATLLDPDTDPSINRTPPEPLELAWACAEAKALLGDAYSTDRFSSQVCRYCGVCLQSQGVMFPPSILAFADFPDNAYPDPDRYADETILTAWTDNQESQTRDINNTVGDLMKLLLQQLTWLEPFGGNSGAFDQLRAAVEPASEGGR